MKKFFALLVGVAASTSGIYAADVVDATNVVNAPAQSPEMAIAANPAAAPAANDEKSTLQKILEHMPKISGYLQTGWNYNSLGNHTSSFQAKRLRLIMDGHITDKASFRLQIEAFNGIAGSTNGNGQKNLQVMDAFATYKFSPAFQVRAGQFYTPMGYENYDISPATLETVDFSNICYRMACRNAIGYDFIDYGRDLGVMLMGDLFPSNKGFSYLSYNLALTNGQLPCKDDNNKSKDIIAALTFRPFKHFNIKASYNYGEYQGLETINADKYKPMNRMIIGAWYNDPNGLDLRAEYGYLHAKKDNVRFAQESGFYVLAGYHFGKFLPVLRYDLYNDSMNKSNYAVNYDRMLFGCTFQAHKNIKIQLNYMLSMYGDDVKASNNGKSTSSQIQLMGLFKF